MEEPGVIRNVAAVKKGYGDKISLGCLIWSTFPSHGRAPERDSFR